MEVNSATTVCFLCKEDVSGDDAVTVTRGLENLIIVSKERKDNHHLFLEKQSSLQMHKACRRRYILKRNDSFQCHDFVSDETKRFDHLSSPKSKKGRRSDGFDFRANCMFCGLTASEEHNKIKRRPGDPFVIIKNTEFQTRIMTEIKTRIQDEICKTLLDRISTMDLVSAEARYHKKCHAKFFKPPPVHSKPGRPKDEHILVQMARVVKYIEDTKEKLYLLADLLEISGDPPMIRATLIACLKDEFGEDRIGFCSENGSGTIMYFKDKEYEVMREEWNHNGLNSEDEETKILGQAAAIIRRHMLSFPRNRAMYPPSDCLLAEVDDSVPDKLQYLINKIVLTDKNKDLASLKRKCTSISHAIMVTARPRFFLSHLQLGLGVMLFRKFGSRNLIDILFQLGNCVSYSEVMKYQNSIMYAQPPKIKKGSFAQFIFDNCDFNTNTIDGKNTFHGMGGILAVTPEDCYEAKQPLLRDIGNVDKKVIDEHNISLRTYDGGNEVGYKNIIAAVLDIPDFSIANIDNADFLWMYGRAKVWKTSGWNGFMGKLTQNMPYQRSKVICLPFVDHPPSDNDTIFTALTYAAERSKELGLHTCFVTFDQPLYQKATQIVKGAGAGDAISRIITRLGGFHLLLSYLGSIGFIMSGSGLEELMSICYAAGTSKKMLYGHAYHRAMRAHSLVFAALCERILDEIEFSPTEKIGMKDYLTNIDTIDYRDVKDCAFIKTANEKFISKMNEIEGRGKTAKLWIQYMRMFQIAKCFLKSEKMGDLISQLKCIEQMLPYFHAAGHFNYARSAHLYVQDMRNYLENMEKLHESQGHRENNGRLVEYHNFVRNGFNTIRRTDKFWSGNFTDMTIEQDFMRMVKVSGGLVNRGFNTSATTKFIASLPFMVDICNQMEEFCGVRFNSSDQHVDARDSRIDRDYEDLAKLKGWIEIRNPFPHTEELISLSTGLVAGKEVNCHEAFAVGTNSILNQVQGKRFHAISFTRKYRVVPLINKTSSIKVQDEVITVDPLLIFQRICLTQEESPKNLEDHFDYELAPFPMSIFDNGMLRKTAKSALIKIFSPETANIDKTKCIHVVDGGMLIHRVPWTGKELFVEIFGRYVKHLRDNYSREVTVVFDGYECNRDSIKGSERLRRANNMSCPDIRFEPNMVLPFPKEKFLSNNNNKIRFIQYLKGVLEENGISVRQAVDDADSLIVHTALQKYAVNGPPVVVVAEDIDIIVLITALTPKDQTIYFLKPGKGKNPQQMFSSKSLDARPFVRDNILFLHAISGSDTTSAFFGKGKTSIVDKLEGKVTKNRDTELEAVIESFKNHNLPHETVFQDGQTVIASMYSDDDTQTLTKIRYEIFKRFTRDRNRNQTALKLATLPPTPEAARQHLYRVYLQVQQWLGNELSPEKWGWKRVGGTLMPVQTTKDPAVPELLKMIFCQCKKECKGTCSCKKAGLPCSSICGSCESRQCSNYKDSQDTLSEEVELEETLEPEGVVGEGDVDDQELLLDSCNGDW